MIFVGMACVAVLGWATTWRLAQRRGARHAVGADRGGADDGRSAPAHRLSRRGARLRSARLASYSSASGASCRSPASCRGSSCPPPHERRRRASSASSRRRSPGATLPRHLSSSFLRFGYGFLLARRDRHPARASCMGWFRCLDDIVTPIFDALRFIAPIAWVPFAALWFGTGIGGPIMIIFAGRFPALPHQRLSRRPLRRTAARRGGADARDRQPAHHRRGAASGLYRLHRRGPARLRRSRLAVA